MNFQGTAKLLMLIFKNEILNICIQVKVKLLIRGCKLYGFTFCDETTLQKPICQIQCYSQWSVICSN